MEGDHGLACSECPVSAPSDWFLFYFHSSCSLSSLSLTKPHSLPPLTWRPPFMIKVQATDDLTHSQNIPAREEGAKPLLSKGNQGHTDPMEALSAKHAANRKVEDKASVGIFNAQHFPPCVPVELAQQVGGDCICLTRAPHIHTVPGHICSFKLNTGNSPLHNPNILAWIRNCY